MDDEELETRATPDDGRPRGHRLRQVIAGLALVALGVAGGVVWSERRAPPPGKPLAGTTNSMPGMPGMPMPADTPTSGSVKSDEPVEVALTPEAV